MRKPSLATTIRRLAAFTLMELLVVLGILGVLVGLISTGLGRVQRQARMVHCLNNQMQLNGANTAYINAHGDAYPLAIYRPQPLGSPGEPIYAFDDYLADFLGSKLTAAEKLANRIPSAKRIKLLTCPEDRLPIHPAFDIPGTWRRTYSMSEANMSGAASGQPLARAEEGGVGVYYSSFWGPVPNPLIPAVALRQPQVTSPQNTLIFVERPDGRNVGGNDHFAVTRGTSNQLFGLGGLRASAYHNGRFVYSYCDGHVAVLEPKATWARTGSMSTWGGHWTMRGDD